MKPQTLWSGPAFAGVNGGVTLTRYPTVALPFSTHALSSTRTVKICDPMFATVGLQQNVPTGRVPAEVVKVAPGIDVPVMVTFCGASASVEFTSKQKFVPAQTLKT